MRVRPHMLMLEQLTSYLQLDDQFLYGNQIVTSVSAKCKQPLWGLFVDVVSRKYNQPYNKTRAEVWRKNDWHQGRRDIFYLQHEQLCKSIPVNNLTVFCWCQCRILSIMWIRLTRITTMYCSPIALYTQSAVLSEEINSSLTYMLLNANSIPLGRKIAFKGWSSERVFDKGSSFL